MISKYDFFFYQNLFHTYFFMGGMIGVEKKKLFWEGGHRTYFVDWGNNWGEDTAQHWKNKVGWLLAGSVSDYSTPFKAPSSILQFETWKILRLAENPTWSPSVAIYDVMLR